MFANSRVALALITLGITGLLVGCSGSGEKGEASVAQSSLKQQAVSVEVMAATRCSFDDAIVATGRFEANELVEISPKVAGRIARLEFDEGDHVTKGFLLVKIEDNEVRFELDRARAELKRREAELVGAQQVLERARELYQKQIAAEANLDDAKRLNDVAQASVEQAKAEVGLAEQRLADTELLAPLDGVLTDRKYAAGELVPVGARILTLLQLSPIKLEVKVPEQRIGELKLGQKAAVTVDAFGGERYAGEISYVNPNLDEVSRNLMVRIMVPNRDMKIKPGMFARVSINTGAHRNILAVPRDAILSSSEEQDVFVAENGTATKRRLELGASWRDLVEIVSGITEGEDVITAGQNLLKDGESVNVVARIQLSDIIAGKRQQ